MRRLTLADETAPIHNRSVLSVACPKCGAPAGEPCRAVRRGRLRDLPEPHGARREAAARLSVACPRCGAAIGVPCACPDGFLGRGMALSLMKSGALAPGASAAEARAAIEKHLSAGED